MPNPTGLPKRRVLVVDDDALIRESLSVMLFEEGYDVSTAANGEEALHCLDKLEGDVGLILLDLTMPVMDGNTLLATLDSHSRYASIPVVIISAVASRASKSASKILSKPLDFEEVLSLVQHHCGPAHQAAQVQAAWA